ncbi:MAG: glycosyltransferase family A protein [Rectinemataceae bacterium]|nr:glycosyltransferase family A protein [Rectinemataceae bacterium]
MNPLFSVGVTSYKRYDLLKECLNSIIRQTFTDYEVIVGNDYPEQNISAAFLGIDDPRIRYVNHAKNMGPIHNANALLSMSKGRYFTWLADDDMHLPNFLEIAQATLVSRKSTTCVFTSYMYGETYPGVPAVFEDRCDLYSGGDFLKRYLSRTLRAIGCYGLFDIEYLRSIGGMEHLGNGNFSPYSDNLLVIRASLLDFVSYHPADLVFFRTHENSVSYTSPNIDVYSSAQADLLSKSLEIFRSNPLKGSFHDYLSMLLDWCIKDFDSVIRRSRSISIKQIKTYLDFIQQYIAQLKGSPFHKKTSMLLMKISLLLIRDIGLRRIRLQLTSSK